MKRSKWLGAVVASFLSLAIAAPAQSLTILGTGTAALVGSDLTDIGDDGVEGSYVIGGTRAGFDAVFFSSDEPGFGGGEFAFNVFDNRLGPGNDKWCCGTLFPQIVGANFKDASDPVLGANEAFVLTSFTLSSANDVATRNPSVWKIQGSNDTTTGLDGSWTDIYVHATGGRDWAARLQVNRYSTSDGDTFLSTASYTAFRLNVANTVGANFQVGELEFFGDKIPEPATLAIFGLGLVGLGVMRRRRAA